MSDAIAQIVEQVGNVVAVEFGQPRAVNPSTPWEEARPLDDEFGPAVPYPVDCLPAVLRKAVEHYQAFGQQPMSLVASSALSAVSVACQGLADVGRDQNLIGPCSLNFLTIAESGERKTAADKRFSKPLRECQKAKNEELAPLIKAAKAQESAWEAKRKGLERKIAKLAGEQEPDKQAEREILERELAKLFQNRPFVPQPVNLLMEDTNQERLAQDLAEGWPSSGLRSDEGGLVVGAHGMGEDRAMGFFALLNRVWDGNPFDQRRIGRGVIHVEGKRFSVSLMMQEVVLAKLIGVSGGAARGTGMLARFLIAAPESTAGTRMFREIDLLAPPLLAFDNRIKELQRMSLPFSPNDQTKLEPPVLFLDDAAEASWIEFHDRVEEQQGPHGRFNERRTSLPRRPSRLL